MTAIGNDNSNLDRTGKAFRNLVKALEKETSLLKKRANFHLEGA